MNRIVLIGNGFDLAHGLKTSYADFIEWYWRRWGEQLSISRKSVEGDRLCSFKLKDRHYNWFQTLHFKYQLITIIDHPDSLEIVEIAKHDPELCDFSFKSPLFKKICNEIETKDWVDIEIEYYSYLKSCDDPKQVNDDFEYIKNLLVLYLNSLQDITIKTNIKAQIFEPISTEDISISSMERWKEILKDRLIYDDNDWGKLINGYAQNQDSPLYSVRSVDYFKELYAEDIIAGNIEDVDEKVCPTFRLPNKIMLLNFNYTNTTEKYLPNVAKFSVNHIHGKLSNPVSVIFGYGDNKDEEYQRLIDKNDNEYLRHFKSFRYQDALNCRKLLTFINSAPYQLCIMGHSCGISDRTLLSTLFEHPNCFSIKPYYYHRKDGTDNYRELVQNIARNISDQSLVQYRVVGKERCEALGKE